MVPRHVERQRAPAAAGLDDALAGTQPQLAADVLHLGDLRVLEVASGVGKYAQV